MMKLIDEKELAQLLLDRAQLKALEIGGVDNWVDYDEAFVIDRDENGDYSYRELREKSIEEITKDYEDYEEQ